MTVETDILATHLQYFAGWRSSHSDVPLEVKAVLSRARDWKAYLRSPFAYLLTPVYPYEEANNKDWVMNWDAVGAVAELIGGVAVLITLIYLSIQVKQNSRMQRQLNVTEQTNRCIDSGQLLASDPEFADLFAKSINNKELSPTEFSRLSGFLFAILTDFEEMYYTHKSGQQSEFRWENLNKHVYWQIKPGTKGNDWWHVMKKNFYTKEFIEYVDELLKSGPQ